MRENLIHKFKESAELALTALSLIGGEQTIEPVTHPVTSADLSSLRMDSLPEGNERTSKA
jgi:hypothetical protein